MQTIQLDVTTLEADAPFDVPPLLWARCVVDVLLDVDELVVVVVVD